MYEGLAFCHDKSGPRFILYHMKFDFNKPDSHEMCRKHKKWKCLNIGYHMKNRNESESPIFVLLCISEHIA